MRIAVIGSGISGLSAAWLLSRSAEVTLFEREGRPGGHSNTLDVTGEAGRVAVDTGFIVYNEPSYPNLTALFAHLGVRTQPSRMSFAVSLDAGGYEYAGSVGTFFGQWGNVLRPAHWRLLGEIGRFFEEGRLGRPADEAQPLGDWLEERGFSPEFVSRHLLPMGAAIWSTPAARILDFPAAAFLRFFENHGLLTFSGRPVWRTVSGGSRAYVARLLADAPIELRTGCGVERVTRRPDGVVLSLADGTLRRFDEVVMACHADQALRMLGEPSAEEHSVLSAFSYSTNRAVLHEDRRFMPRRRRIWASWNYLAEGESGEEPQVTYWMNSLQGLPAAPDLFVTLNPRDMPRRAHAVIDYRHPVFDAGAIAARRRLWDLQGRRHTWFCGSYFGDGFHEDGLQSGLAVAEALGAARRPWTVEDESGRIHLRPVDRGRREAAA